MPVFRSPLQALLLARVLPDPSRSYTLSELARVVQSDVATVSREATRLVEAGVLREQRVGRTRLVSGNESSPVYEELTGLAVKTFGPAHLASDAFAGLAGVVRVVVFGSWAARFAGVPGRAPADLDVLLVGDVSRVQAHRAADQLQERLGLAVGLSFVSEREWDEATVHLVREIQAGPHLSFEVDPAGSR